MLALNGHVKKFRATADIKHDLKYREVVVESEGVTLRTASVFGQSLR